MVKASSPKQGDIILLSFNPQTGHEQQGRRPAFVVSNDSFHNLTTSLAMVCPITSVNRGFPLHVPLDHRTKTRGVIMCEQAQSLDLSARKAVFLEKAPQEITEEVIDILIGSVELLLP